VLRRLLRCRVAGAESESDSAAAAVAEAGGLGGLAADASAGLVRFREGRIMRGTASEGVSSCDRRRERLRVVGGDGCLGRFLVFCLLVVPIAHFTFTGSFRGLGSIVGCGRVRGAATAATGWCLRGRRSTAVDRAATRSPVVRCTVIAIGVLVLLVHRPAARAGCSTGPNVALASCGVLQGRGSVGRRRRAGDCVRHGHDINHVVFFISIRAAGRRAVPLLGRPVVFVAHRRSKWKE